MKNSIVLISFAFLFVFIPGCSRNGSGCMIETDQEIKNQNSIVGIWELRQTVSMIGTVNHLPGNGSTLTFRDSTYSIANSGFTPFAGTNQPDEGTYIITEDSTVVNSVGMEVPEGEFQNRIFPNNDKSTNIFFEISGNKLVILAGYFPLDSGIQLTYERK